MVLRFFIVRLQRMMKLLLIKAEVSWKVKYIHFF